MAANNLRDSNLTQDEGAAAPRGWRRVSSAGRASQAAPDTPVAGSSQVPGYNASPETTGATKPRWKAKNIGGDMVNGNRPQPSQPSEPRSSRSHSLPQQVYVANPPTTRDRTNAIFYREARRIQKDAQTKNNEAREEWVEWHPDEPEIPAELLNEQAFDSAVEPLMKDNYRTLPQYEESAPPSGIGTTREDTSRTDRWIDNLVDDMQLGFFHITTEHVVKDKNTGTESVRWSAPVEDAMTNVMEYFGLHGITGQQTVFRLVRMYASMGVDSDGKMFNEGKNEWSLNEREFRKICDLIVQSCIQNGHPMAMPTTRWQLRGTDIYPSGVMPRAVAQAITGPESRLNMNADELIEACRYEWLVRTYPTMRANLYRDGSEEGEKNEISQRIAIERMQQALSRLDGTSTEDFSKKYKIDTTLHHKLSEYEDINIEYVVATNGNYDADKVAERQKERIEYYKRRALKQKHVSFHIEENEDLTETVVIDGVKHRTSVQAGVNLITSLARINSVVFRPILAVASVAEHAVGNARTWTSLTALSIVNGLDKKYRVGKWAYNLMKTERAVESLDASKMLFEVGGPGAARLFRETGKLTTHENVIEFLRDTYIPNSDRSAQWMDNQLDKVQRWSQKLLVGDLVFKKSDTINWFNALLVSNAALGKNQEKLARKKRVDQSGGIALTGAEIEDILKAHTDVAGFFTEMMGTNAGISAYNMMRANSVAQVNPISYYTDRFLRDHGIVNMMITLFFDTFPVYCLNFVYNLVPFSRTMTYLGVKLTESAGTRNAIGNVDLTIGGNLNNSGFDLSDPGFRAGLYQNLMFDAVTIGYNLLIGGLLGLVFIVLGFEPPEDEEDKYNISMWKIGGEEIQWAWWLNDLTLLANPIAYYVAVLHKTGDRKLAGQLAMDSLHDQVNGNVILDFAETIANWRHDIIDFEQMTKDPSYTGPTDRWSFVLAELYGVLLNAGNKLTPGSPLWNSLSRSALFRGEDARAADPRKVFKRSNDPEMDAWYQEHQITENVDSYMEVINRKYSMGNWLYALANNIGHGAPIFSKTSDDSQKTGYFWWQMPVKTYGDNFAYVWAGQFAMDYDNIPEGMSREQYEAEMANKVLNTVEWFENEGLSPAEAAKNYGFIIPGPARHATERYLYDELAQLDQEWINQNASGELVDKNDYQVAKGLYYQERNEITDLIYGWFKSPDVPEWGAEYEQLLTDYDITYVDANTGDPIPMGAWDIFNPDVEAIYKPKGNHPTDLLPLTTVDYSDNITNRGHNAETVEYFFRDGMTGTDAEALRNLILPDGTRLEDATIPMGRDSGKRLGDVAFGMQSDGTYSHPDEPTTGWRALVPRETGLSDETINIGKDYEEEWKNKKKDITNAAWDDKDGNDNGWTLYPRRSYGRGYGRGGYSKGSTYNPKIYSVKAQTTHNAGTRVGSTRTNPNARSINADRAATMYSKQPNSTRIDSYLRPGFSTKGSREAYKRQDI